MYKELKSCTGVLLRADLTGHGHSSPFCQNRCPVIFLDFRTVCVGQSFKNGFLSLKNVQYQVKSSSGTFWTSLFRHPLTPAQYNGSKEKRKMAFFLCFSKSLGKFIPPSRPQVFKYILESPKNYFVYMNKRNAP